jgi:hypothetical protein
VILFATLFVLVLANLYIAKWGFANMISTRAETTDVADLAVSLGPSDPQTHYSAGVIYDKTFLPADQQRSISEYETALALSPHNYLLWLEYGKALSRNGDLPQAETALRQAQALAPNFASVAWALGNLLVRNGKDAEGFDQIRRAIDGDATLAAPATAFAYQYFDGDISQIKQFAGASPEANAALASLLTKNKRYDDAVSIWRSITGRIDTDSARAVGRSLVTELIAANKYQLAAEVQNSLGENAEAVFATVHNGTFEDGLKLENAGPFDWQFSSGAQPQPLQSTAGPHGGTRSLVLRFASNDGGGLKQMSQTVLLKPGGKYALRGSYRSDLKTSSQIVWQVTALKNPIAEIPVGAPANNWTDFTGTFTVPPNVDGVDLRLVVKGCGSAICPINGSLWLDDISLTTN